MIQRTAHGGVVDGRAVVFQITEYQTENRPEQQQLQMPELRGIQPAQTELTVSIRGSFIIRILSAAEKRGVSVK